jgi:hypothetical protein
MSVSNFTNSSLRRSADDVNDRAAIRARLSDDSPDTNDRISNLERAYESLGNDHYDYDLLRRVEKVRQEYQISLIDAPLKSFTDRLLSTFMKTTSTRIEALYDAVLKRHHLTKDFFYRCSKLIEQHSYGPCDLEKIKFLAEHLDIQERGEAVKKATMIKRLDFVEILLLTGNIDTSSREKAILNAAKEGSLDILNVLLDSEGISQECRGKAVMLASEKGHLNCVKTLLNDQDSILTYDRGKAVILAVRNHYESIVHFLLSNQEIFKDHLSEAVIAAVEAQNLDLLNHLLNQGRISENSMGLAIIRAASDDSLEIVAALVNRGYNISANHRAHAMDCAIGPRRDNIILLLQDDRIVFTLTFEDVAKNPKQYLKKVVEEGFPERIELHNADGNHTGVIDAGGVTKGFVTLLFKSLQKDLNLDPSSIPNIEKDHKNASELQKIYQNLGHFFSLLLVENKNNIDPFLIGPFFHEKFYEILKIVAKRQTKSNELKQLAHILNSIDPNFLSLTNFLLNPDNQEYLQTFADIFGHEPADAWVAAKDMAEGFLAPARHFLQGSTPELKKYIQTSSYQELCNCFQGHQVSKEALKQAFTILEPKELLTNQLSWILEKIDSCDLEWCVKFVKWATERSSLPLNLEIILQTSEGELQPHTCTNTIDIPTALNKKEDFLAALDSVLDSPLNRA